MTTNTIEEAACLLLERALKTTDPAVVVDVWDDSDWSDTPSPTDHVVYARRLRSWVDLESGLLRVEADLEANWESAQPVTFAVTAPHFGNGYVLHSWDAVKPAGWAPGFADVTAVGWVPELLPLGRNSKGSTIEAPGLVVDGVSAALGATSGPWTATWTGVRITADPVRNNPSAFVVKVVAGSGSPVAATALLAAFTPRVGKLAFVNLGTLGSVDEEDAHSVLLTVS